MKVFMDRFTPYWINRKLEGKKVVIMGVGASTVEIVGQMMERLEKFVECFGMKII
jgi:multimeric flavodoxin WrbA